ncbi:S8 family serine peptidase [Pseudoneobacillus sp. C159]
MLKKSTSILFASLLALSNGAAYAAGPVPVAPTKEQSVDISAPKLVDTEKTYAENEKVRVVVELSAKPAIDYAQKQGVKYSDLNKTTKLNLEADALAAQKKVISALNSLKIKAKVLNQFTTVVNGFSAEVEYGKIPAIEAQPGVANVYIANEYERPVEQPEMLYSKELVQAQKAWDAYGYKGEGIVVGVIDTGIDYTHKDMVLSSNTNEDLTKAKVDQIVTEQGLPGKYYSKKVPYAYNYMDNNNTVLDLGSAASMHGMHVSGTVGANGDENNGGIKGVAPEAQILGLKVFGNDPEMRSTWGDIYVKAIDDAIKLGVDVINMSLGSTAGFVSPDDPEQKAVSRAVDNGVVMSISAGNSAHFGAGHTSNPFPANPDIGLSGSPGLSYDSIQVASYENSYLDLDAVSFTVDGALSKYPFKSASSANPLNQLGKSFEIVDGGLGKPEQLTNAKGKYALIQRGELDFVTKTKNAQAAGAVGAIIYNNTDGWVNMATEAAITIPQLFMLKSDGDAVIAALKAGKKVNLAFNGDMAKSKNPDASKMSSFTSWGLTPDLDFKPEITAPGGQILSTFNNNKYGMMSGTSMAAPHVSGGSALVLQRVDKEFALNGFDRVQMAKNILMNTAQPVMDKGTINNMFEFNIPYSPRREGAGLMQLHAALSTPVIVTDSTFGEAKVALKQINGNKATFTLKAKNYSDKAVSYDVSVGVQTDLALFNKLGYTANELEAQPLEDVVVKVNGADTATVDLAAKEEKTINVELDLTNAKVLNSNASAYVAASTIFKNGYFVDGFVTFKDKADTNPTLSVPFTGFKGKWDQAPVVDAPRYDTANTYYGYTSLLDESLSFLGYDLATGKINPNAVAISPNGDGLQDTARPVLSFLRNAKKVEYNILDKNGNKLRTIRSENNVRKHYYNSGSGGAQKYSIKSAAAWDGKVNLKTVAEGDYQFEIRSVIDFPGAQWQSIKLPVKVDLTAPTGTVVYNATDKTIKLSSASDNANGSGVSHYDVVVNGKLVQADIPAAATYKFTTEVIPSAEVKVVLYDFAGNSKTLTADSVAPDIHVVSPGALTTANSKTVPVTGYVTDSSGLASLTVAGKAVDVVYNEASKRYEFTTTVTFDSDGVKTFEIKGVDLRGNEIKFQRSVFVDSTPAKLNVIGAPTTVQSHVDKAVVSLEVEDNYDEIQVLVNGSEVYYNSFEGGYEMRAFKKTINDVELPLAPGVNTFVIDVIDFAGHKTTKTITITREAEIQLAAGQGYLTLDHQALGNLQFSLRNADGSQWYDMTTDANGIFTHNLPDGNYVVEGIWKAPTWYPLNMKFTLTNGLVNGSALKIEALDYQADLTAGNVTGTLSSGTNALTNLEFSIHSVDGNDWYAARSDSKGQFVFNLPDGTYQVDGIWVAAKNRWYELNQQFTVVGGKLQGSDSLAIDVKASKPNYNVTGTLYKGYQEIPDLVFSLRTESGDAWYSAQTDEDGKFGFNLPNGTYIIEGIWIGSEGKWYALNKKVIVNGGQQFDIQL